MFLRTTRLSTPAIARTSQVSGHIHKQQRNMALITTHKLNTGAAIPAICFGMWQDKEVYGTEPITANAIKKTGIPRSELFITTKLWNNSHYPENVEPALDASVKNLGTDYVDLYRDTSYIDTYRAMEKLLSTGKTKAIGISNFSQAELEHLLKETSVVPTAHRLELHPWLQQKEFVGFNRSKGIHITPYSPFGNQNEIYDTGKDMGKLIKYNKTGAQVALAWGIAKGHGVIPKLKTPARIKQNIEGDFEIEPKDIKKIDDIDKKLRFNDASAGFRYDFFS
ncbi:aldehyde reductase-like protein [Halenospora varia]|nr:aldehyde reductase-like protein [Halenospora varia]